MSSAPPNPPGGMPPYAPYDPKNQWRAYREQQKAAWRTQRDAWRAQRHVWKAQYWGTPRVPSIVGPLILIAIGVVWLLIYGGRISGGQFWAWYGHWWPWLLILAGLALLGEWALDVRSTRPVRRGGSFVGLLVVLAILGIFAAGWNHMSSRMSPWMGNWNGGGSDFFNFGLPEHDMDQQGLAAQIPARAVIDIEDPRGDVSIAAGDGNAIDVQSHEEAFAHSGSDAAKIFTSEAAHLNVSGNAVEVKSGGDDRGRVNLTITVPKAAQVTVNAARGDVSIAGLGAGVDVNAAHGDTHLSGITGPVVAHLANGKHDFSAHQIVGNLTVDGATNDLTLSGIKGEVAVNGEIFGDVHIENISGPIKLETSVTGIQIASLPGDMTLDSDDLRVTEATGAVHVSTHAKDVDLSQIYGDSYVEDSDGTISVEPAGAYGVEARNGRGDVEVTLPPDASETVDGHTHNGNIDTDYGLAVSGDEDKTVTGRIGSGSARVVATADNGDLSIKKGPAFPATPPAPGTQADNAAPAPPEHARHLKASKALPPQPVTQ